MPNKPISDPGWKEAAIAWEVCASIHREYAKGRDALFTTRQGDFVRHAEEARKKALAGVETTDHSQRITEAPSTNADETVSAIYRALSRGHNREAQALASYYLGQKLARERNAGVKENGK